jgi:hypothetical protein
MTSKPTTTDKPAERKQADYTKLDTVNLTFNRPAKWYMYVVKQVLKTRNTVDIRARPLGAAQVVRVAEALKRLGYITYEKYYTTTIVADGRLQRYIVVTVKKTPNFQKLFDEREAERTKMLEAKEKEKKEEKK